MNSAEKVSDPFQEYRDMLKRDWSCRTSFFNLNELKGCIKEKKGAIVLYENNESHELLENAIQWGARHIVNTEGNDFLNNELNVSAVMDFENKRFLDFPIASILAPKKDPKKTEKDFTLLRHKFNSSDQKDEILREVETTLKNSIKSETFISEVRAAADELITNAVYNAPFADTSQLSHGADRSLEKVSMGQNKEGEIFIGKDDERLVVGCKDPFGSLNLSHLFQRIIDCYKKGLSEAMNFGPGGAGVGSFLIFDFSTSYYATVVGGQTTLICFSVPYRMSRRKRSEILKSLHFFSL